MDLERIIVIISFVATVSCVVSLILFVMFLVSFSKYNTYKSFKSISATKVPNTCETKTTSGRTRSKYYVSNYKYIVDNANHIVQLQTTSCNDRDDTSRTIFYNPQHPANVIKMKPEFPRSLLKAVISLSVIAVASLAATKLVPLVYNSRAD